MRYVVICIAVLMVSACARQIVEPVGIGRGVNDLKQSPCACYEIKQEYDTWKKNV